MAFNRSFICSLLITVGVLWGASLHATTIVVNTTAQEPKGIVNDNCSLGEAIQAAATDTAVDACPAGSGDDVIQLLPNAIFALQKSTASYFAFGIENAMGAITIDGLGATIERDPGVTDAIGVFQIFNSSVVLKNLTITNGLLPNGYDGAAIDAETWLIDATLTLDNVTLSKNNAVGYHTNAILARGNTSSGHKETLVIKNSLIENNTTDSVNIYALENVDITIQDSTIRKNAGRGVIVNGGTVVLQGDIFYQNISSSNSGGALLVGSTSTATITQCSFIGNKASVAGAIENDGNMQISKSVFKDNVATNATSALGGAIINNSQSLTVVNSTFTGNQADKNGSAIENSSGTLILLSSTVTNNRSSASGGSAIDAGGSTTIGDDVLYGNELMDCNQISFQPTITSLGHNIITDNGGCPKVAGDVAVKLTDPVLATFIINDNTAGYGVFPPTSTSPAIGKGDKCPSCPSDDQLGVLRDSRYDIGAVQARCGDAVVNTGIGEACDDGNFINGDGCNSSCAVEAGYSCSGSPSNCQKTCGDGKVDAGEQCDDGNLENGDGCSDSCAVEAGYSCLVISPDTKSTCLLSCGDGKVDAGEQCDDGNKTNADGCSTTCKIEAGYTCSGAPSVCKGTCGDGKIESGEQCDDNNIVDGDGCSSTCQIEKPFTCTGEPSVCAPICGDGIVIQGVEKCDDGNKTNGDGCSDVCKPESGWNCIPPLKGETKSACYPTCGDGIVVGNETCDDGNDVNGDGCNSMCFKEVCGDGVAQTAIGEQCDGADLNKKDCTALGLGFTGGTLGCKADCSFDTSQCVAPPPPESCGDGKINGTEVCDGADLGGKSCTSLGLDFTAGTLTCKADCTLDTTLCTKASDGGGQSGGSTTAGGPGPKVDNTAGTTANPSGGAGSATGGSDATNTQAAAPSGGASSGGCSLIR